MENLGPLDFLSDNITVDFLGTGILIYESVKEECGEAGFHCNKIHSFTKTLLFPTVNADEWWRKTLVFCIDAIQWTKLPGSKSKARYVHGQVAVTTRLRCFIQLQFERCSKKR